jgi:ABC-type branched-subunit amino acid transport system substrate-binding protein
MRRCTSILLVSTLITSCAAPPDDDASVTIGVLLPFTGRTGGTAHSLERAVLTAQAELGDTLLGGRPLRVLFADTHSSVERGLESAQTLLDAGATAVIGVESDELASALLPVLEARDVLLLSPNVSSAPVAAAADSDSVPWFRVAPSTGVMADNLAKTAIERGARTVAVLHTSDQYNHTFARLFGARFAQLGGSVSIDISLPDDRQSYSDLFLGIDDATHVLLAAPPEVAARVVNDVSALRAAPVWYLTPALRTEVFATNTVPGALVGSLGVAPQVEIDPDYAERYASLWDDEAPLESSLLYYDAAALFILGYARATEAASDPTIDELAAALFDVARTNGIQARWYEIASGVEDLAAGRTRYYRGLTGPIVFDSTGQRGFGQPKLWTVNARGELLDVK